MQIEVLGTLGKYFCHWAPVNLEASMLPFGRYPFFPLLFLILLQKFLLIYFVFYVCKYFAYMCVCIPHMVLMPMEVKSTGTAVTCSFMLLPFVLELAIATSSYPASLLFYSHFLQEVTVIPVPSQLPLIQGWNTYIQFVALQLAFLA